MRIKFRYLLLVLGMVLVAAPCHKKEKTKPYMEGNMNPRFRPIRFAELPVLAIPGAS